MSNKERIIRQVAVALMMAAVLGFTACSSSGAGGEPAATSGTIEIVNVTPSSGLTNGVTTDFTVVVDYTAIGGRAELGVGFNSGTKVDESIMIVDAHKIVDEGNGSHTFTVSTTVKDWGAGGDFEVYVNISAYPHPDEWSPINSDTKVLLAGS